MCLDTDMSWSSMSIDLSKGGALSGEARLRGGRRRTPKSGQLFIDGTDDGSLMSPLSVIEVFPDAVEGASGTRHVSCDDGYEYAMKLATVVNGNPYLPANEWVAARLARRLSLPIIPFAVLRFGDQLAFGSRWINRGLTPFVTPDLLARCRNVDVVHDLVAFDAWIINGDRHPQNLWVRQVIGGHDDGAMDLVFPDHGHAIIPPGSQPDDLSGLWLDFPAERCMSSLPAVRNAVTSLGSLRRAVAQIRDLPDDEVRTLVRSTPAEWLSQEHADLTADFLLARRERLQRLLSTTDQLYPALRGGTL